jgi:hypothetical protein
VQESGEWGCMCGGGRRGAGADRHTAGHTVNASAWGRLSNYMGTCTDT